MCVLTFTFTSFSEEEVMSIERLFLAISHEILKKKLPEKCSFLQFMAKSIVSAAAGNKIQHSKETYVYWTVHHCDSCRIKGQLHNHLLFYFPSYVPNMFRTLIYPSLGACDFSFELPYWSHIAGSNKHNVHF